MSKPPSLQDVARAANLSPATVSRYLNGSLALPADTSARIDRAIAELRYQPNPHARSLSRGRSDTIGLVIPEIDNPFFAKLAAAVERRADAAGLALMLCSSLNRKERELHYIERLRRNFVDGLLFATNHVDTGELVRAIGANSNVVIVDEDIDGLVAPKVFSDNREGGRLAAEHLLAHGHRRMAFIGGPQTIMSTRERSAGFREAAIAGGATVAAEYFGSYSIPFGREAARRLIAERGGITALFVASDEILYGVLDVMRESGLSVGDDLSIITYDDAGPLAFLDPPITAVRQPIEEMGRKAFEVLRDRLNGMVDNPVILLPVELIERKSVKNLA
jgi:LacI family transcriptional regulator